MLSGEQARELLDSIDVSTLVGLRDRALIAVMTFAFARIGAEVATLLTGPAWPGHLVIELGSMVSADQVAEQLGEVLKLDVKAFAVPRAGWAEAFEHDAPGVSNLGTWVRRHPRRRGGADAAGLARL